VVQPTIRSETAERSGLVEKGAVPEEMEHGSDRTVKRNAAVAGMQPKMLDVRMTASRRYLAWASTPKVEFEAEYRQVTTDCLGQALFPTSRCSWCEKNNKNDDDYCTRNSIFTHKIRNEEIRPLLCSGSRYQF
jgi:hypothetical protein